MIEVQLKYFGAFRNFMENVRITRLEFTEALNVSELKAVLTTEFQKQLGNGSADSLIKDSAVATEEEILPLSYRVERSCTLLFLPPVCGG